MRIRLAYKQCGPARYLGHLDVMRAFERAFRRAGLPLVYSRGFNPRPRMVFAAPLPLGFCGGQEYVDVELADTVDLEQLQEALNRTLPAGLEVFKARKVPDVTPALMSILNSARYTACGELFGEAQPERVRDAVAALMARGEVYVERETDKGLKKRDIRLGIRSLQVSVKDRSFMLIMELAAGSGGTVRPDEVLIALSELTGTPLEAVDVWRTALLSREGKVLWEC
ncbi:TIGR03936 family radical SAM-associated protein [Desulforudis sp. 1088]|uniref:TIGR03936 family radical SAM-associated protein n=1 Tax=unclassified Candidatus Desulforudis TaxID=2635950 RepID=UPI003CE44E8A